MHDIIFTLVLMSNVLCLYFKKDLTSFVNFCYNVLVLVGVSLFSQNTKLKTSTLRTIGLNIQHRIGVFLIFSEITFTIVSYLIPPDFF